MKNNKDKFGFAITELKHEKKDSRRYIKISYKSEDEGTTLVHVFNKQDLAKNPSIHRQYEQNARNQNILETFAMEIIERYLQYGDKNKYVYEFIVQQLPRSIILDNKSMKEFYSYLPQNNELLMIITSEVELIRKNLTSNLEK